MLALSSLVIGLQIAFAHMCEAEHMGEFTRAEFCRGCDALGVGTIQALVEKLPQLRKRCDDDDVFEEMYNYVFTWACPKGKRYAPIPATPLH